MFYKYLIKKIIKESLRDIVNENLTANESTLENTQENKYAVLEGLPEIIELENPANNPLAKIVSNDLFALINTAYSEVGGHMNVKSPGSLYKFDYWIFNNPTKNKDNKIKAAVFASKTRNGSTKVSVFATDSSAEAKTFMIKIMPDVLNKQNWWAEIPEKVAGFLHGRGVNMVDSEETARLLLGGRVFTDFQWHGQHPTKPRTPGEGYYSRSFAGKNDLRAIMGNVTEEKRQQIIDFIKSKLSSH